jgi:small subunit ribosomal protein S3
MPPHKGKNDTALSKTKIYARFLMEDEAIRETVNKKISLAGVSLIEIERTASSIRVFIKAARPGLVIGRGGKGVEELSKAIEAAILKVRGDKKPVALSVNIEELRRNEISAEYTAQQIAWDLEKRMSTRRTMKKYLDFIAQNRDVRGAKILVSGRVDGGEIARREVLKYGSLPLQNLRADIDYGTATAFTTYGTNGIKVWIYKGEIFAKRAEKSHGSDESRGNKIEK